MNPTLLRVWAFGVLVLFGAAILVPSMQAIITPPGSAWTFDEYDLDSFETVSTRSAPGGFIFAAWNTDAAEWTYRVGTETTYNEYIDASVAGPSSAPCAAYDPVEGEYWIGRLNNTAAGNLVMRYTTDDGVTWQKPTDETPHNAVTDTSAFCDITFTPSGDILVAVAYRTPDDIYVIKSSDRGATWDAADLIHDGTLTRGGIRFADSQNLFFTSDSDLKYASTTDEGDTWTLNPDVESLTDPDNPVGAIKLNTGRVVTVWESLTDNAVYAYWSDDLSTWNQVLIHTATAQIDGGLYNLQTDGENLWFLFKDRTTEEFIVSDSQDDGESWQNQVILDPMDAGPWSFSYFLPNGDHVIGAVYLNNVALTTEYAVTLAVDSVTTPAEIRLLAQRAFNGLVGFDAHPSGEAAIVRHTDVSYGDVVTTMRGSTLALQDLSSQDYDTGCAPFTGVGGVFAGARNVAWVDCPIAPNTWDIQIRDYLDFDAGSWKPDTCEDDVSICPEEIDLATVCCDFEAHQVTDFDIVGIDYGFSGNSGTGYSVLGLLYTDLNNEIVTHYIGTREGAASDIEALEVTSGVGTDSNIDGICTAQTAGEIRYIVVDREIGAYLGIPEVLLEFTSPTASFNLGQSSAPAAGELDDITVTDDPIYSFNPIYGRALAVDCKGPYVAIATEDGRISLLERDGPTNYDQVWTATGVDVSQNGLGISSVGPYTAYVDDATLTLRNPDGVVVATKALQSTEPVRKVVVNDLGTAVWVALADGVYLYDLSDVVAGDGSVSDPDGDGFKTCTVTNSVGQSVVVENVPVTVDCERDTDGDGDPDVIDTDDDDDGIPDHLDPDDDGDGVNDEEDPDHPGHINEGSSGGGTDDPEESQQFTQDGIFALTANAVNGLFGRGGDLFVGFLVFLLILGAVVAIGWKVDQTGWSILAGSALGIAAAWAVGSFSTAFVFVAVVLGGGAAIYKVQR